MKKLDLTIEERIRIIEENSIDDEKFCCERLGMPILTKEEKIIQRKKTYNKILKEVKNNPPIDSKKLLQEVKNLIILLESEII